jgi:NtrC-family two-component system response regulator AlgB
LEQLKSYLWPGNIRELRNTIERAAILGRGNEIGVEHLPYATPHSADNGTSLVGKDITLDQLEEAHIRKVLDRAPSLDAAARTLGIDPATLYRKRKRMNL